MIKRTTWIILVIFVGLLGLTWYLQKNPREDASAEPTPNPGVQSVFDFDETALARVKVEDGQGQVVALERDAQGMWTVVTPEGGTTDAGQAQITISQFLGVKTVSILEGAPAADATGLDATAKVVTLDLSDGRQVVTRIGKLTPIGNGYYVQTDSGPVSVVGRYSLDGMINWLDQPPLQPTPTAEVEETAEIEEMEGTATPQP